MNLFIYTGAATLNAAIVTSATDLTPLARLPDVVFGDSEPVTVKFLSAAGTYESWSGAAGRTLSVSIGEVGADGARAYFNSSSFTTVTDGWTGTLGLATPDLAAAVTNYLSRRVGFTSAPFTLQVRVTIDATGYTETYAKQTINVGGSVALNSTPSSTPVDYATAADVAADATAAAASALESASSAAAAAAAAAAASVPIINYVFEGDSLTASAGDAGVGAANTWPALFQGLVKATDAINFYNVATSGDTAELIVGEYASEVAPYKPASASDTSILFFWAGTNDIGNGRTAANIYNNLKLEWAQARADGFTVVAFTLLPRTGYVGANETTRLAVNTFIRSDASLYDVLIEPDVYLPSAGDTYFYNADGIHKNRPANQVIAVDAFAKVYGATSPRHDVLSGFNGALTGAVTAVDSIERAISRLQNAKLALTGGTLAGTLTGTTINAATIAATTALSLTKTGDAAIGVSSPTTTGSAGLLFTNDNRNASFGISGSGATEPNQFVWYGLGGAYLMTLNGSGRAKFVGSVGFNNTTPVAKPTVTGSRGGNAALASLLTALAATGLLTDGSTA